MPMPTAMVPQKTSLIARSLTADAEKPQVLLDTLEELRKQLHDKN